MRPAQRTGMIGHPAAQPRVGAATSADVCRLDVGRGRDRDHAFDGAPVDP